MNRFFNLYANCIPVKGHSESIIVDLQNNEFINIPNLLFDVIEKTKNTSIDETKNIFDDCLNDGIDHYFNYLYEIDYGFYLNNIENFPELNLDWFSPLKINNAILEINENYKYDFISALKELSSLGCSSVQIRIDNSNVDSILNKIISATRISRLRNVEIIIPEHLFKNSQTEYMHDIENRISSFIIHSVQNENLMNKKNKDSKFFKQKKLLFTSKKIYESTNDIINKKNFIINMDFFCEAKKFNVALNRTVCIDSNGNYKNFLSHKISYGNFNQKDITTLIEDRDFTRKWFISNDNIDVCKDCQFRYICFDHTDIEFNNSSWKKVTKCPFNPYTNTWDDL